MLKPLIAFATLTFLLGGGQSGYLDHVSAQTRDEFGGRRTVKYTLGQRMLLRVVNRTPNDITLQSSISSGYISLRPGQQTQFDWTKAKGVPDDFSFSFWSMAARSLQAVVTKPNATTFQIELRPGERSARGDGWVQFNFDGWVRVY